MRALTLTQISTFLQQKSPAPAYPILGYAVDSRHLKAGELFFALKGERVDGHAYLTQIQEKGAAAAVISKDYQGTVPLNLFVLRVEDPLMALQEIARQLLAVEKQRIVAITGSLGKTTTKEFINTLLSGKYRTCASPGNSNSQIGLPLAILNHFSGDEEILILEMGMTHPGQITQLTQIAPPEVAVLINVSLVHACNFENLEEIARAKAEIFQHPDTQLGILHREIPLYESICQTTSCPKVSFAVSNIQADYAIDASLNCLTVNLEKQLILLDRFKLPGKHNLQNLLAAIAVARYFKVSWEEIQQRIELLELPERRLQLVKHKEIVFINDSYNAAELSVKAALECLPHPTEQGRKIAVLGSMMELGKFSNESHQRVGEHALNYVEELYCFGEECRPAYEAWKNAGRKVELFDHFSDLISCLKNELKPSDVVLIKGSCSKQMWRILEEF